MGQSTLLTLLLLLLAPSQDHHHLSPCLMDTGTQVCTAVTSYWTFWSQIPPGKIEHLKGCWDSWRILRMGRLKMCQAVHGQFTPSTLCCSVQQRLQTRIQPQLRHCINTAGFRHFFRCAACRIPHSPAVLLAAQITKGFNCFSLCYNHGIIWVGKNPQVQPLK